MKKALISILGTNNYHKCRHKYPDGKLSDTPVKYAQEDLIKHYCKSWDENCEIRIFLTSEARSKNWENNGHRDKDSRPIENIGLRDRIANLHLPVTIKDIDIPNGFTEKEIWEIFEKIYDSFREEEEVIIDITHAFRFMPLLLTILLTYAELLKHIKIQGIYYAAFESLGAIQDVTKMKPEERITPILDLSSLVKLQSWTLATFDFLNYGNVSKLSELIKSERETYWQTSKDEWKILRDNVKRLEDISLSLALCRGKQLKEIEWDKIRQDIINLNSDDVLISPFAPLLEIIEKKISNFAAEDEKLLLATVDWCFRHNLFQQAITLLQEFSITLILQKENLDWCDKTYRDVASQTFRIYSENIPEQEWRKPASDNNDSVKKLLNLQLVQQLAEHYNSLTELRNDVNHAGFLNGARSVDCIKNKLKKIINNYKEILTSIYDN